MKSSLYSIIDLKCTLFFRYEQQNQSVAACTSDVIQEKNETEVKLTRHSEEMKSLKKAVTELEEELRTHVNHLEEIENKIERKHRELQDHITNSSKKRSGILRALVPFYAAIQDAINDPIIAARTQSLQADLSRLNSERSALQNKEWNIQVRLTDLQLKLASSKIQLGESLYALTEAFLHLHLYLVCNVA